MHGSHLTGGAKPRDLWNSVRRLWSLCGKERIKLILVFLIATAGSAFGLAGPWLIGRAVDTMAVRGGVDLTALVRILVLLGGAYAGGALLAWFQEWWIAGVAQRVVMRLRRELFSKVQGLPLSFFDAHSHGELMSRLANDVDNVSTLLSSSTTSLFSSVLMLTGSFAFMLSLSPVLTALALTTAPLTVLLTRAVSRRSRKLFKEQQRLLAELNGHVEEVLSGQTVVKAFGQEERTIARFDVVNTALREAGRKAQVLSGLMMPMLNVVTNIGFVIVATAGGLLAESGIITVGVVASFLTYSRQFARPINEIASLYSSVQSAQASAERVFDLMDETPEPADAPDAEKLVDPRGHVEFLDVSFGYRADVPVLRHISLDAPAGRTIALVGPTGAGKTTLATLLVRFYDSDTGSIRLDGRDLRGWTRDSLRDSFAMVLQDTHLFSGSVRENIRYGRLDATDAEVEEAAARVGADPFIRRLPAGYDTELGEAGEGFSQGQRQLLSIARAVLADPAVLILDEATSSVDTRTEMVLQQAMLKLRRGRTSFIVAHRLSTIRDADEILVIDGGAIIERGSHSSLMGARGFYWNLYSGQFDKGGEE
jgi:ATP-binding cassette subfamily B protein